MSYTHTYLDKESRFVVLRHGHAPAEFKSRILAYRFQEDFEGAIIKHRFTTQQLELETQGWTPWNIGDATPKPELFIQAAYCNGSTHLETPSTYLAAHLGWSIHINAWRLSNADGYKDGVKVEQHGFENCTIVSVNEDQPTNYNGGITLKPEWKAGELPITGTVCEVNGKDGWEEVTICGHSLNSTKAFYNSSSGAIGWATATHYRPIQTDKERVIAKVKQIIAQETESEELAEWVNEYMMDAFSIAYDAGCLIDSDKGEE